MTREDAVMDVSPGGEAMKERLIRLWTAYGGDYDEEGLETMTELELFDAWLTYEGILGYTEDIIQALRESGFIVKEVEDGQADV